MKKRFSQIIFLVVMVQMSLFSQNSFEINTQGTRGIIYSKGIATTDIASFYRGGIVSELPSTLSNTTGKIFSSMIGFAESNGDNMGVLGIASTNNSNSNFGTGVEGRTNLRQGTGIGVAGSVFASSIASDYAYGGDFRVTALNNTNSNIQLIGVKSDVNSNFNTVSAEGYGMKTEVLGNFGSLVFGNLARLNLGATNTATAYGGYFQVNNTGNTPAYGIFATAGTGNNKFAGWFNGRVLLGTGTSTTTDLLEVDGSATIKNNLNVNANLDVNGTINVGANGTLSKYLRVSTTMGIIYPANNFTTLTVTVAGAEVGDNVVLNYTADIGPLIISQVWVSAANTVSVKFYNPTGTSNNFPNNTPVRVVVTR
jgi:hypothetical protein